MKNVSGSESCLMKTEFGTVANAAYR